MAKFPIAKGSRRRKAAQEGPDAGANASKIDVKALTKKARYIVDEAGRRQSVIVDYETWQQFLHQVGAANAGAGAGPAGDDSEYALRPDHAQVDLYRPQQASGKDASDYRLESSVTRRGD